MADGTVSLVFRIPAEFADQAFAIHPYLKKPVKIKLYEVRS